MKLILTALCASFMVIPAAFASECEKNKGDKDAQKEEGTLADCGKCDKDKDKDEKKDDTKKEGTLASDCEKDECDKDGKKAEGTLAHEGECDKDKDAKKAEGTLA